MTDVVQGIPDDLITEINGHPIFIGRCDMTAKFSIYTLFLPLRRAKKRPLLLGKALNTVYS
ncbi:hypothetical protein NBRC116492_16780 [Aurantivibrio infirmus]